MCWFFLVCFQFWYWDRLANYKEKTIVSIIVIAKASLERTYQQ